jgi:hypothetical protein
VRGPGLFLPQEDRRRKQVAVILDTDPDFPNTVSDEENRAPAAATIYLSKEIELAAFRAALTAPGGAGRRHTQNS